MQTHAHRFSAVYRGLPQPRYLNGVYYHLPENALINPASIYLLIVYYHITKDYERTDEEYQHCVFIKVKDGKSAATDVTGGEHHLTYFFNWFKDLLVTDFEKKTQGESSISNLQGGRTATIE